MRVAGSIGFVFDRQRGSHAVFYRHADQRRIVVAMHGAKDLKPGTLRAILSDMGLSIDELREKL